MPDDLRLGAWRYTASECTGPAHVAGKPRLSWTLASQPHLSARALTTHFHQATHALTAAMSFISSSPCLILFLHQLSEILIMYRCGLLMQLPAHASSQSQMTATMLLSHVVELPCRPSAWPCQQFLPALSTALPSRQSTNDG